jgi:hypothetical protein
LPVAFAAGYRQDGGAQGEDSTNLHI